MSGKGALKLKGDNSVTKKKKKKSKALALVEDSKEDTKEPKVGCCRLHCALHPISCNTVPS